MRVELRSVRSRNDDELLYGFTVCNDEAAFAAIVARYQPLVWAVCWRALRHQRDAEDAVQATFILLMQKAPALQGKGALGGWLYAAALHTASNLRRKKKRQCARELGFPTAQMTLPITEVMSCELHSLVSEEIQRLPEKYRLALVRCYVEERSIKETAQILGCNKATLKSRLAKARKLLARRLVDCGALQPDEPLYQKLFKTRRCSKP